MDETQSLVDVRHTNQKCGLFVEFLSTNHQNNTTINHLVNQIGRYIKLPKFGLKTIQVGQI